MPRAKFVKRFDNPAIPHKHLNNVLKKNIVTPHVHDPNFPGGVRYPYDWEVPR